MVLSMPALLCTMSREESTTDAAALRTIGSKPDFFGPPTAAERVPGSAR